MDFKAIPSRRSNRNIGRTTGAERAYDAGRCVRNGLHTSLAHGAPVARKVLTLGGGGVGNAAGAALVCLRGGRATSAAHKAETRRTGNPRPPAAHMHPPLVAGGGASHPGFFNLQAAIHPQ